MRKHSFRAALAAACAVALSVAAAPSAHAFSSMFDAAPTNGGAVANVGLAEADPAALRVFNDVSADAFSRAIFDATNRVRAQAGVAPLQWNADLGRVAQEWSETMAKQDRMYHRSNQAQVYPAGWRMFGENVLQNWNDASAEALVQQWYDSAPHRASMLNGTFNYVGIGYAVAPSGKLYATQNFMWK